MEGLDWWQRQPQETLEHIEYLEFVMAWKLGIKPEALKFGVYTPFGNELNPIEHGFVISVWEEANVATEDIINAIPEGVPWYFIINGYKERVYSK